MAYPAAFPVKVARPVGEKSPNKRLESFAGRISGGMTGAIGSIDFPSKCFQNFNKFREKM